MTKALSASAGGTAKHGRALVARTRKLVLNAFDAVESRGRNLSEILADEFIANPLKFMDTAAKFMPRDITIEASVSSNPSTLTDSELAHEIATRARQRLEQAKDVTPDVEPQVKTLVLTDSEAKGSS